MGFSDVLRPYIFPKIRIIDMLSIHEKLKINRLIKYK